MVPLYGHTYPSAKGCALSSLHEALPTTHSCSKHLLARKRSGTISCCHQGPTSLQQSQTLNHVQAVECLGWDRGGVSGREAGVASERTGETWAEGLVGRLEGDRKVSPELTGRNRKSHRPCCQVQGQAIWFQFQLGH